MYNELVAVTLIIVYERIFERCKVERSGSAIERAPRFKFPDIKVYLNFE